MVNKKSNMSIKEKENIKKRIGKLDYNEQCEIFNIIRKDTDKISENNNGVFINLKYLKDETLIKILEFVEYCEKNKLTMKEEEKIYDDKIKLNNTHNIQLDSSIKSSKSEELNRDDESSEKVSENLSEGYESYNIDNDYLEDVKISKTKDDKFSFKSYIDKLSVSSQKAFQESVSNDISQGIKISNQIPVIQTKKLKLTGVKARLMRRCRNINKFSYNYRSNETDKNKTKIKVETIINDNMSELDKISNYSEVDGEEGEINIIDDDSYIDNISNMSNELSEDLDFLN